jgi:membrane dipeptidase
MAITEAPIIASHSNSRTVYDNSRNLTDEMFLAICKTGGVVGINLGAQFLGENATLDTVCDHILHFIELDPDCKHIGLGGDLDGVDILPAGFSGCESYAVLADRLIQRGLTETQVADIFWNNAFGVIERAVCNNTK